MFKFGIQNIYFYYFERLIGKNFLDFYNDINQIPLKFRYKSAEMAALKAFNLYGILFDLTTPYIYGFEKAGYQTIILYFRKSLSISAKSFKTIIPPKSEEQLRLHRAYHPRDGYDEDSPALMKRTLMDVVLFNHQCLFATPQIPIIPVIFMLAEGTFWPVAGDIISKGGTHGSAFTSKELRMVFKLCYEHPDHEIRQAALVTFIFAHKDPAGAPTSGVITGPHTQLIITPPLWQTDFPNWIIRTRSKTTGQTGLRPYFERNLDGTDMPEWVKATTKRGLK